MKKKILRSAVLCLVCVSIISVYAKFKGSEYVAESVSNLLAEADYDSLKGDVLRFHVIANSDSSEDQIIKMRIKNEIVKEYSEYFRLASSKEESIDFVLRHSSDIIDKVNGILSDSGFEYRADAYVCDDLFPDKYYGDLLFPKGEYTALKIVLGEGKGKNWWCVLYPPLCFLNVGSDDESAEYSENNNGKVQVRSRFVEWLESVN